MSDEINIKEMPTDELLELMHEDLYDGYADEVVEEVEEVLARGMAPYEVLTKGLVAGMDVVGEDFRDGILFVPEVLMAAKAMKAGWPSCVRCWPRLARQRSARWSLAR